ncbi:titin homolog [Wyeomyia smithii]|uniref:titin homolog n=1 Tax=Wyeomyia smithii TaxID=174621 RepID=UPI002467DCA2|nr:titin homolog [Wyeomyia smithii]
MVVSKDGKRRRKVGSAVTAGAANSSTNNNAVTSGPSAGASSGNASRGGAGTSTVGGSTAASHSAARESPERDLSPPEVPKRPKVQAQRKFAQGQGAASTSAYLNFTTNPPNPVKDAQNRSQNASDTDPIPELLPNMRPNTEDFLTFLCFRGTPVLPPSLDFFNTQATAASGSGRQVASSSSASSGSAVQQVASPALASTSKKKEDPKPVTKHTADVKQQNEVEQKKPDSVPTEKPTFMPFAVRKRAEQHPENRRVQTVQALRKKYHEQRMAKLRVTAYSKQTRGNNIKGRPELDDDEEQVEVTKKIENQIKKDEIKKISVSKKKQIEKKVTKKLAKGTKKEDLQELIDVKVVLNKDDVEMKATEPENAVPVETVEQNTPVKDASKEMPKTSGKSTKKKPALVAVKEKRTTRLSVLRSPPQQLEPPVKCPTPVPQLDEPESEQPITEKDFSSDDDEPLLKRAAVKKKQNVRQDRRKGRKSDPLPEKASTEEEPPVEKKTRRSESINRRSDAVSKKVEAGDSSPAVQKRTVRGRKTKDSPQSNISSPPTEPARVMEKKQSVEEPVIAKEKQNLPESNPEQKVSPKPAAKKTVASSSRKKKPEPTPLNVEPPEVEQKKAKKTPEPPVEVSTRPSRKTKEAATLYMELIGRRLNHDDKSDDDASSLDSLELPNVRKLEQMENELKANAGKKESKVSSAKKGRKKEEEKTKQKQENSKVNVDKDEHTKKEDIKQLEKSFSDSDEEPLATKFQRKKQQIRQKLKQKGRKSSPKKTPAKVTPLKKAPSIESIVELTIVENTPAEPATPSAPSPVKALEQQTGFSSTPKSTTPVKTSPKLSTPVKTSSPKMSSTPQMLSLPPQLGSPTDGLRSPGTDDLNSTRVNKSHDNTFQSTAAVVADQSLSPTKQFTAPAAMATQQQPFIRSIKQNPVSSLDVSLDKPAPQPEIPFNRNVKNDFNLDESDFMKGFEQGSPTSPVTPKSNSLLGNLLPSKEESEKIFGIASVSLAQSSGPLDTKCTLGKCGSVHKPPLGPPVLTESLLGGHLSPRDRRKTKVNMTHEQIQKWIDETSWSAVPDDLDADLKILETPKTPTPTPPSAAAWEKLVESKSELVAEVAASVPVTPVTTVVKKEEETKPTTPQPSGSSSRGPTLKAKPVPVKPEKEAEPEPVAETVKAPEKKSSKEEVKEETKSKTTTKIRSPSPPKKDAKKETRKTKVDTPTVTSTVTTAVTTTTATTTTGTPAPSVADRKPIYKQGRTPVYKQEALKSQKAAQASNKFGAFSPDNEPSVYSFDNDDSFVPVATPFRRHSSRRESCNSSVRDEVQAPALSSGSKKPEPAVPNEEKAGSSSTAFQKPVSLSTPTKAAAVQPAVSLTLSPEDGAKSAAITVPLEEQQQQQQKSKEDTVKKEEKKSNAEDSDDDGHTFYIPLQGPNTAGTGKTDQLIQGVAVKLGTEGPEGPNQRVIMHAKLVTKAQMGSNTTPIPESMNVQELVKSLMTAGPGMSKDGISKMVPVGTVQPRFKSSDSVSTRDKSPVAPPPVATTPTVPVAPEDTVRGGGLSRINSNSSLSSSQRSKPVKGAGKAKLDTTQVQPANNTAFPRRDDPAQMVEAPVFKPNDKEFHDPIEYIERIAPVAARFGICRIIPPASFKPECRITDDMRFMAYNQYVHKMLHRWGPSAKEYAAIKKYLATQSINLQNPPLIGGMEVDLPRLYHTVQELGGLKEVIEKKKWARVAEDMCIPKAAHDRVSKLDDIYCKYLLPYDTLSPAERQKLFDEVEADWAKREAKARRNADKCVSSETRNSEDSDDDEEESNEEEEDDEFSMECIMKGRNMPLNQFFRIARNTMSLWFKNSEPTVPEIESEYWRHVAVRDSHVCVHSGSIDSSAYGFGFPAPKVKGSSCARHPWNLKVLTNNNSSILRSLGPVMGITIPTLHVGMLFSACCWYRDPHGLPWIEYLHTGASKIWYGVPDDQNSNFRTALTALVPTHCQNKTIWLPCDTAMVPPHMLTDRNVSLCRTEQQPGQFVVVFPRAYTSSLCTGYAVSESVYFASTSWLDTAKEDFRDIQESCEPTMFSVEQLVFSIANDQRSNHDTLVQILPMISDIYDKEKQQRQTVKDHGVIKSEKIESKKKTASLEEFECDICRANLYLSLIRVKIISDDESVDDEDRIYCLKHGIKFLSDSRLPAKFCQLAYTYSLEDIEDLLRKLQDRVANRKTPKVAASGSASGGGRGKSSLHLASTSSQSSSSYQAPSHSKYAGMATMLK